MTRLLRFGLHHWVVVGVIATVGLGFGLRASSYVESSHPSDGAGLVAEQAEMARNAVDHGKWFSLNPRAYDLLQRRQAAEGRLVDLSEVDFTHVDRLAEPVPVVDQMPGVAIVLTGLWWITDKKTYAQIQWLQIVLDTAMILVIYWIAVRLTRRQVAGLLAAVAYAVWPWAIYFAKRPLLDSWATFFTIACVAAFVWAREQPTRRGRLLVLGVITGFGIYFRPFVVLVPVALAVVAGPGGWPQRLRWAALPTAVALALLAPWTIRNYYDFHRFIPTRTGLGQALFEGNGQATTDEQSQAYVRGKGVEARYGTPTYDQTLLHAATRSIGRAPGAYIVRVGRRARLLLPCLLVLVGWRRWKRATVIPATAAASTIVPYLFVGSDRRFYAPAAFAYLLLIAMAATVALSLVQREASRIHRRTRALDVSIRPRMDDEAENL